MVSGQRRWPLLSFRIASAWTVVLLVGVQLLLDWCFTIVLAFMDSDNLDCSADLSVPDWFLINDEVQSPAPSHAHISLHVSPKCKASPLAAPVIRQCLSRSRTETRVSGTPQLGGLAAPSRPQPTFSSHVPDSNGLQVPHLHHVVPRSLMLDTDTSSVEQGTRVDSRCSLSHELQNDHAWHSNLLSLGNRVLEMLQGCAVLQIRA